MRVALKLEDGLTSDDGRMRTVTIGPDGFIIGRDPQTQHHWKIIEPNNWISRKHLMLRARDNVLHAIDVSADWNWAAIDDEDNRIQKEQPVPLPDRCTVILPVGRIQIQIDRGPEAYTAKPEPLPVRATSPTSPTEDGGFDPAELGVTTAELPPARELKLPPKPFGVYQSGPIGANEKVTKTNVSAGAVEFELDEVLGNDLAKTAADTSYLPRSAGPDIDSLLGETAEATATEPDIASARREEFDSAQQPGAQGEIADYRDPRWDSINAPEKTEQPPKDDNITEREASPDPSVPSSHPPEDSAARFALDEFLAKLGESRHTVSDEELIAFCGMAGEIFAELADATRCMLMTRSDVKRRLGIAGSEVRRGHNPLKLVSSKEEAVAALVRARTSGYLTGVPAVVDARETMEHHQRALATGVVLALERAMREFDPEVLEEMADLGTLSKALPALRKAALWDAFVQNYDNFVEQAERNFRQVVGRELDDLYSRSE